MARILVVLAIFGALAAALAWFLPEGVLDHLLKVTVSIDVMILGFAALIGSLQWASDRFTKPEDMA
jgi:hypothetical protein